MFKSRIAASFAAVTCLASTVYAADLPSRTYTPETTAYNAPSYFTWTGFYAGVNVGYGWPDGSVDVANTGFTYLPQAYKQEDGSFTGGIQAGYNYQMSDVVFGVEGDLNLSNMRTRVGDTFGLVNGGSYSYEVGSKVDWFGTARARIGFAATDRLLVFGTGGLAFGGVKTKATDKYTAPGVGSYGNSGSTSDTRFGWTLGLGAEYAITQNITAKLEYSYVSLSDDDNEMGVGYWATNVNGFTVKDDPSFQLVRAGVNYKF